MKTKKYKRNKIPHKTYNKQIVHINNFLMWTMSDPLKLGEKREFEIESSKKEKFIIGTLMNTIRKIILMNIFELLLRQCYFGFIIDIEKVM